MKISRIIDSIICGLCLMLIWCVFRPDNYQFGTLAVKGVLSGSVLALYCHCTLIGLPNQIFSLIKKAHRRISEAIDAFLAWGIGTDLDTLDAITDKAIYIDSFSEHYPRAKLIHKIHQRYTNQVALAAIANALFTISIGCHLLHFRLYASIAILCVWVYLSLHIINHLSGLCLDNTLAKIACLCWLAQIAAAIVHVGMAIYRSFFSSWSLINSISWFDELLALALPDQTISVSPSLICIILSFIAMLAFFAKACALASEIDEQGQFPPINKAQSIEEEELPEEEEQEEDPADQDASTEQKSPEHPVPLLDREPAWAGAPGSEVICFIGLHNYQGFDSPDQTKVYIAAHGYINDVDIDTSSNRITVRVRCEIRPGDYPDGDFFFDLHDPCLMTRDEFEYFRGHTVGFGIWLSRADIDDEALEKALASSQHV